MGTFTTKDGVEIFYKDWGSGQPVVFSHGWPLTADAWDPGSTVSQGKRDEFWLQCMTVGIKSALDCTTAYVPTLIAHGDDDQIVPSVAAARKSIDLVKGAQPKVYPGAPHGLHAAYEREFNGDLLAFLAS
jgi:non-heme chloroperoxidase